MGARGGGDGEAFGQLFDRHSRADNNHCFRLTASWSTRRRPTGGTTGRPGSRPTALVVTYTADGTEIDTAWTAH